MWFTDVEKNSIGRLTTSGTLTTYPLPTPSTFPFIIVVGPDHNLCFSEPRTGNIGRITPDGTITEFFAHFANNGGPTGLTLGPNGELWFADPNDETAGAMNTAGSVVTLLHPSVVNSDTYFIAAGPDGNLWFTGDGSAPAIGRLTPTGTLTEFDSPDGAMDLTVGPDAGIWFTSLTSVNRVDTGVPSPALPETPSVALLTSTALLVLGAIVFDKRRVCGRELQRSRRLALVADELTERHVISTTSRTEAATVAATMGEPENDVRVAVRTIEWISRTGSATTTRAHDALAHRVVTRRFGSA